MFFFSSSFCLPTCWLPTVPFGGPRCLAVLLTSEHTTKDGLSTFLPTAPFSLLFLAPWAVRLGVCTFRIFVSGRFVCSPDSNDVEKSFYLPLHCSLTVSFLSSCVVGLGAFPGTAHSMYTHGLLLVLCVPHLSR